MKADYSGVRNQLPRELFKPYRLRIVPIIGLFLIGVSSIVAMVTLDLPWYLKFCLSLVTGYCWAIGGLFGHDLLHGSVVRSKKWQDFVGFFCFLPFLISPTFWRYWHNNLHHSNTQKVLVDPDAYPILKVFKQSRFVQWMFPLSPGSGHKRSALYFFFWFSVNTQVIQHYLRYRNKMFDKLDHKKVNRELALGFLVHGVALFLVGPSNWLWAVLIPFAFMNYLPFSYISTNHNLSPLTKENDPLMNSLTVTNPPILEFFHINFGYHVEHHLFPTMSSAHLKKVHQVLKKDYPEKYQFMPKWKAIYWLYKTPRIYKNNNTLVHPETGETFPVLGSEGDKVMSQSRRPQSVSGTRTQEAHP